MQIQKQRSLSAALPLPLTAKANGWVPHPNMQHAQTAGLTLIGLLALEPSPDEEGRSVVMDAAFVHAGEA